MQTVTEILIDFSTSMTDKIAFTKQAILNDIIPYLDYSAKIGIKTFSAPTDDVPEIITILELSITNKEQITSAINALSEPNGNTPIAAAIKNSVDSLKEYLAFDKKIILLTDGQENCDGNYISEVEQAKKDGINCQIHIIGFGLDAEAEEQAVKISTLSNGSFSAIADTSENEYNQTSVKENLSNFYDSIKKQDNENLKDLEENTELNERIEKASEEHLFKILRMKYPNRVFWLNENGESNTNHDFEILNEDGSIEYYIECKGSQNNSSTFYLTKVEWRLFLNHAKNYQVFFC